VYKQSYRMCGRCAGVSLLMKIESTSWCWCRAHLPAIAITIQRVLFQDISSRAQENLIISYNNLRAAARE
jgi:hypothetical protein